MRPAWQTFHHREESLHQAQDPSQSLLIPHNDITALQFKGDNGYLSLFNVDNEITNNNTLKALDLFYKHNERLIHPTNSDNVLWHHPIWEDNSNEHLFEPKEFITPLIINLLYKCDMVLVLPKGILTLQTAAGNWTRPDNVWWCNIPEDPIQWCDTVPAIHPPLADHLLVITILDLPLPRTSSLPTLNFQMANWDKINELLGPRLKVETPAMRITPKEEFVKKVDNIVHIVYEVLQDHIYEKLPNPFKQHWWMKDLTLLKKTQNWLINKSHKLCHVRDHPVHADYKAASNKFKEVMTETCSQDWMDWLKGASQQVYFKRTIRLFKHTCPGTPYSCTRTARPGWGKWEKGQRTSELILSLPTGYPVCATPSGIPDPLERAPFFL